MVKAAPREFRGDGVIHAHQMSGVELVQAAADTSAKLHDHLGEDLVAGIKSAYDTGNQSRTLKTGTLRYPAAALDQHLLESLEVLGFRWPTTMDNVLAGVPKKGFGGLWPIIYFSEGPHLGSRDSHYLCAQSYSTD